jgi:hypothetical protein
MPRPTREERRGHGRRELVGKRVREGRPIDEPRFAFGREAREPLVAGLLTDLETATQLSDRPVPLVHGVHKIETE